MPQINLVFEGYWREARIGGIPAKSGIYVVYDGVHNAANNTASLRKILYVGESENGRARIACHERWADWKRAVGRGGQLYFAFAPIATGRARSEAALIHRHKPPLNTEYVDIFPFERTTVVLDGTVALLQQAFTLAPVRATAADWSRR